MHPSASRKPHANPQPEAHKDEQYNIYKVPAQDVIRNGECEKPIRRSLSDHAQYGGHSLTEAIRRTQ